MTMETQRRIRQTTAGGALPVRNMMKEIPQLAGIQLDYYLLNKGVNQILYLNDPDAMTPETWRPEARKLAEQMKDIANRMEELST